MKQNPLKMSVFEERISSSNEVEDKVRSFRFGTSISRYPGEMEEVKRRRLIRTPPQLEDVPELIHIIQSLLPVEEATRTCVLSKSWLHAWSTIPTLRFHEPKKLLSKQQKTKYMRLINRSLRSYCRDNIPIQTFDLQFSIHNEKSASLAKKWIRRVAPKSCLEELYLTISVNIALFTLPDEIFSGENLNKISVTTDFSMIDSLCIIKNPVINCVNLRVLKLINVHITEELLHNLFSACILLKKIELSLPKGLKTIKVKNLRYLRELKIISKGENDNLEINDVPSLGLLSYDISLAYQSKLLSFNMDLLRNVRELVLYGLSVDNAFPDIINSKFPFLESLTLKTFYCNLEILNITSVTLKRLNINLSAFDKIDIQVYAPQLLFFCYNGGQMRSLLFPTIAPEQIELSLKEEGHIDNFFFLKMRETLNLSSKFKIKISITNSDLVEPFDIDVGDLRRRALFPATNVEQVYIEYPDEGLWGQTFFDAFILICHPNYVEGYQLTVNRGFWKQIVTGMMEKKTKKEYLPDLKDVEIKNPDNGKWETLTSSWINFHDRSGRVYRDTVKFKLTWSSP